MAEKLIELRQRFRGYAPVNTREDSDEDSDDEMIGARNQSSNLILGVSHRPAGGYRDPDGVDTVPVKKSFLCKLLLGP